jgi:ribose/xylose/arabinose/galactoside ABC-type transport system permease subunit
MLINSICTKDMIREQTWNSWFLGLPIRNSSNLDLSKLETEADYKIIDSTMIKVPVFVLLLVVFLLGFVNLLRKLSFGEQK